MKRTNKKLCPVCHKKPVAPTLFVTAGKRSLHNGTHCMNPGDRREVCGGCVPVLHIVNVETAQGSTRRPKSGSVAR